MNEQQLDSTFTALIQSSLSDAEVQLNGLAWYPRLESLYSLFCTLRGQGLDRQYASAALKLWTTAGTEELLSSEALAALQCLDVRQLCGVVYALREVKSPAFAGALNALFSKQLQA